MTFPVSPTNGQQSTIANIVYQYASATNSWTVVPGYANTISATGNITASYFFGNGSQLTGLSATYANANVAAYLASGTDSSNIITTGNVTGGNITTTGLVSATGNITSAGNISGSYILGNGSQLTGLSATYANANVAAYLASGTDSSNIITTANISGGNILTVGLVSATGNITSAGNISGSYILGNGSQLTGLPATYANANVAAYLASGTDTSNIVTTGNVTGGNITTTGIISLTGNIYTGNILTNGYYYANGVAFSGSGSSFVYTANTAPPSSGNVVGAQWYNTTTGALYEYQSDGTSTYWVDVTGPTIASSASSSTDSLSPFLLMGA